MTPEEYLEYWKSMSADELIVRCGNYIAEIAKLEAKLTEARNRVHELEVALETANSQLEDLAWRDMTKPE